MSRSSIHKSNRVYVAGHTGLVGSAIVRRLENARFERILTVSSGDVDLRCPQQTEDFFCREEPEYVFVAAAHVGGIHANQSYPATFLYDNIMIASNVINSAHKAGVTKLLFLGSSCIYPKHAAQPIKEDSLLTGPLEPTNEPYAIAKIAGVKLCQSYRRQYGCNFISVMPTNLYGPNDNFDLENSHVVPALLRKVHEAKCQDAPFVTLWGTGKAEREFLHVDDLADACFVLMQRYDQSEIINVGSGEVVSIQELAEMIRAIVGFKGLIQTDPSKPDGTMHKRLDSTKCLELGWESKITLDDGLRNLYDALTRDASSVFY